MALRIRQNVGGRDGQIACGADSFFFSFPHFFCNSARFFLLEGTKTYPLGPHWKTWFRLELMKNMKANIMKTLHSLIAGLWPARLILARRIAFSLLFLGAGLMLVQPCAGAPFQFEETGSLTTGREVHTASLLPNGKVLVAGGISGFGAVASVELYDPASGT
jgi:hypothetical protein